jgi:hypothetical protein
MNSFVSWLSGKKTYITGAASVLSGVAGVATGTISPAEGVQMLLTGLMGIFLRNAVAKQS